MADADCKSVAEKTAKSSSDSSGSGGQSKSDDDMNADIDPVVVDEDDLEECVCGVEFASELPRDRLDVDGCSYCSRRALSKASRSRAESVWTCWRAAARFAGGRLLYATAGASSAMFVCCEVSIVLECRRIVIIRRIFLVGV